jgi:hypothetical protein
MTAFQFWLRWSVCVLTLAERTEISSAAARLQVRPPRQKAKYVTINKHLLATRRRADLEIRAPTELRATQRYSPWSLPPSCPGPLCFHNTCNMATKRCVAYRHRQTSAVLPPPTDTTTTSTTSHCPHLLPSRLLQPQLYLIYLFYSPHLPTDWLTECSTLASKTCWLKVVRGCSNVTLCLSCSRTLLEHLYTSIIGAVRLSLSTLLNIAGRTKDQVSRASWRSVKERSRRMVLCWRLYCYKRNKVTPLKRTVS